MLWLGLTTTLNPACMVRSVSKLCCRRSIHKRYHLFTTQAFSQRYGTSSPKWKRIAKYKYTVLRCWVEALFSLLIAFFRLCQCHWRSSCRHHFLLVTDSVAFQAQLTTKMLKILPHTCAILYLLGSRSMNLCRLSVHPAANAANEVEVTFT